MSETTVVAVIAVIAAALGGGGAVTTWIQRRGSRPSAVQIALDSLREQVDDLRGDVQRAEARAKRAEERADEVVAESQGFKATIAQQTKALNAKDGRIIQLVSTWPPGSRPPAPNPEHAPYL